MRRRVQLVAIAAGVFHAGCDSGAILDTDANPRNPRVVAEVRLVPSAASLSVGDTVRLRLVKVMSDGTEADVDANFTSPDEGVLFVDPTGIAYAVGGGLATVSASGEGFVGQASISVSAPPPDDPDAAIVVHAVYVVESAPPDGEPPPVDWQWHYAPQLVVSASPGRSVRIIGMQLSLPGVTGVPSLSCSARVTGDVPRRLNGDDIGDVELAIHTGRARSLPGVSADVSLTYVDEVGAVSTQLVHGLIISSLASIDGGPGACTQG